MTTDIGNELPDEALREAIECPPGSVLISNSARGMCGDRLAVV
jgi:hypothetical protein